MPKTLISGGTIVDGTGHRRFVGDLLIEGDQILEIRPDIAPPPDAEVLDASGKVVSPGFVDLHSHADYTLLAFPSADSAIRQGITTVSVGNCGGGVAPASTHHDVTRVAFAYNSAWGVELSWESFGEFSGRLDGAGVNVAPLVPHGAIRNAVMGLAPREATTSELATMRDLLVEALDAGAFGMSTGLEYLPGQWASVSEIRSLVSVVGEAGGMYATHIRNRSDSYAASTLEALDTSRDTGARVQLSHFAPRPNTPRSLVDHAFSLMDAAVEEGQPIGIDTFPERWGPALLVDLFPPELMEGSPNSVLARLTDPTIRRAVDSHFADQASFLARVAGYGEIYLSGMPEPTNRVGSSLSELAARAGTTVGLMSCDLLLEASALYRSVGIRHIYATESDLRMTLERPYCSIESDGIVTPGEGKECPLTWNASSYGYTARVLEYYVRDEGFFTLEEAVHRMAGLPARSLGLDRRGTLQVGNFADVVVFDPLTISDTTTPDDVAHHPAGIDAVIVNGALAFTSASSDISAHGRLLTR
jgi:N-acyl-D-amino-acid deacylase